MLWNAENSYLERDFIIAAKKGAIKLLTINEGKEGYYITLSVSWSAEDLYVTTRRDRSQPRYFKDLDRLIKTIRGSAQGLNVTLNLSEEPPAKRKINRVYKRKKAT
jgi:hypothetical protein